jgi:hypothetical protein
MVRRGAPNGRRTYPTAARRNRTIIHASRPAIAAIALSLNLLLRCLIAATSLAWFFARG